MARKYVHDLNLAEEVVQNLFIDFWNKRETLIINTSLKSYLYKATINKSIDFIRKRKSHLRHISFPENIIEPASSINIEAQIEAMELEEALTLAINNLPAKCQTIFKMSRWEGMTYGQIATQLNVSQKAVEKQMSKALMLLRAVLNK